MAKTDDDDSDDVPDEYGGYYRDRRTFRLPLKRKAINYLRQSTHEQRKKRRHSLVMQEDLYRIAVDEFGYASGQVIKIDKDLGISGTLTEDDRPGLAELLQLIQRNEVEAVFVVKPDRLYRDQTLVGPIDFALLCQQHDVCVVYIDYRGPTIIDFNHDEDFEDWIKMSQESARELKNMQVRMGGARYYKAKSGKYAGGMVHWGWRYDAQEDRVVVYEPHRQTVLNITRVAANSKSLLQVLRHVKQDPTCWFHPFQGEDLLTTYRRHVMRQTNASTDKPYMPQSIYQISNILTCPLNIGIRTFGSGKYGQYKIFAKAKKQKRGKVRSGIRVRPLFLGMDKDLALMKTSEEQDLFWQVQERFNPVDLRYALETKFKKERSNPNYQNPRRGKPGTGLKNAYAGLVRCGLHGQDEDKDFRLTHAMRIQRGDDDCWTCGKDHDLGLSIKFCTNIRRRVMDRVLDTQIRLRLSGGQQFIDDLVRLIEVREQEEGANQVMLRQKLANLQQAIDNYAYQLKAIDLRTDVGKYLFNELQERLAPLLNEKQLIEGRLGREKTILDRVPSSDDVITVREALARVAGKWKRVDPAIRNKLLRLIMENIVVYAVPGKRTVFARFRWRDGTDDWAMFWYWGQRNNEPWAEWEKDALRRMWVDETETSARKILNALKPGRKWRTVRAYARKLGLTAAVRRPDADELFFEQDKEKVPTDGNDKLVYYHLGRVSRGELPSAKQAQEVFEKDGKTWIGNMISEQVSVYLSLFPFACINAPIVISTPMPD